MKKIFILSLLMNSTFSLSPTTLPAQTEQSKVPDEIKRFLEAKTPDDAHQAAQHAFTNPAISRKQILDLYGRVIQLAPQSETAKKARLDIPVLHQMVAEDHTRAKKPVKPLTAMKKKERISELIYRLRDEDSFEWDHEFSVYFSALKRPHQNGVKSPGKMLLELGYKAVPQLIDAIGDSRFTRSWQQRRWSIGHVLRVGDCAAITLERIAGRSFRPSNNDSIVTGTNAAQTVEKASKWWRDFQKKGEKQMLIEGITAGDDDSSTQADRLLQKYPDVAFDAVTKGIQNAKEGWVQNNLLIDLYRLKDKRMPAFLRTQLKRKHMNTRVLAARELYKRGHKDGLEALLHEWEKLDEKNLDFLNNGLSNLILALVTSNSTQAIIALSKNIEKRSTSTRHEIINALAGEEKDLHGKPLSKEVGAVIDEVLVTMLDDKDKCRGLTMETVDGKWAREPRICDLAGKGLSERWEQPKLFNIFAPLHERERQLLKLKNFWRKKNGLNLLPPPKLPALPLKVLQPKLQEIVTATNHQQQTFKSAGG